MTAIEGGHWRYYNNNLCNKNETNIWMYKVREYEEKK